MTSLPHKTIHNERGAVLVAALLVMIAITVVVASISMTTVVEKTSTVSHRVTNRALYAADSGLEAVKQQMTLFAQGRLDSLNAVWAGNGAIIDDPGNFFPGTGFTTTYAGIPSYNASAVLAFEDSTLDLNSQAYNYRYTVTSTGSYNNATRQVVSEGRLRVSATRGSFADYLIFTDEHLLPDGRPIWFHTTGHFDGRVHTNDQFRFAYYPTFEDQVTSVAADAIYYNDGSSITLNADFNSTLDVPDFFGGFNRGVPDIPLPSNAYSQERAALGGNPADTSPLDDTERRALLGLGGGGSVPKGVYVPASGGVLTGGLYVSGDAQKIAMSVDAQDRQVMDIRDDNGDVTRVVIDYDNGQTLVTPPSSSTTSYTGVPRGVLYTDGSVDHLSGPTRISNTPVPAIAPDHKMTLVASADINIQGDLASADFDAGESILGIFTPSGDVIIGDSAPDELVIDSFVMASGDPNVFTVEGYNLGDYRGQVHLRGGMITHNYGAFGTFGRSGLTGYGRDFRYDRRGLIPPFFPLTQRFVTDDPVPQVLAWRES